MINFNLQTDTQLSFGLNITGSTSPLKEARLTITLGSDMKLSLVGIVSAEGCTVNMQGAKAHLVAGEYPCALEVFIDQNVFVPVQDTLAVTRPTEVVACVLGAGSTSSQSMPEGISVTSSSVVVSSSDKPKKKAVASAPHVVITKPKKVGDMRTIKIT